MAAAYRADSHEEQVLETRDGDLVPAVRARLIEMCERGEVLAQARPPWLGKPGVWLLVALLPLAVTGPVLAWTFGSLRHGSLVAGGVTALGLWTLGAGVMSARSWWHWRRATLPPGVHLFVVGLLEVSGERLRLWPASRVRIDQRGADVDVDLGPSGRLRLSARVPNVARSLAQERERLDQVQATSNTTTFMWHEPLAADRALSGWRPVDGEPRPRADGELQRWPVVLAWLGALVAIGAHDRLHLRSDAEGIRRAQASYDLNALRGYLVAQGSRLPSEADRALVELLVQKGDDTELLDYLDQEKPAHGEALRRAADEAIASHVLRPSEPPLWLHRWTRLDAAPGAFPVGTDRVPLPLRVAEEQAELLRYSRVSPHRRTAIREQAFRLTLHEQAEVDCELPPNLPDSDLSPAFHQEVEATLAPLFFLRRGERCGHISEILRARALAGPPALREAASASLRKHLLEVHERASASLAWNIELKNLLTDLVSHIREQPDAPRRSLGENGDEKECRPRPRDPAWLPLLDTDDWMAGARWHDLMARVRRALPAELACADTPPEGPRLQIRPLTMKHPVRDNPWQVEVTLTLPGQPVRRERLGL